MKKRTEILAITLVLTGSAIAAALTSDLGIDQAHAEEAPAPSSAEAVTTADESAPEESRRAVISYMDIPLDVVNEHKADSPQTADPQPTDDQVATERSNEQDTPNA